MAEVANQVVQGGHMVTIKVGGVEVGLARSSSMTQDYGTEGVYHLHSVGPAEHVPMRWAAQITLDEFVIHTAKLGEACQLLNLAPMGPENVLSAGVLRFEILDDQDTTILVYEQCTISNFSLTVTANQLSGQNATFQAKNVTGGAIYKGSASGPIGEPAAA